MLVFMHGGLADMNYSQHELRIPHGRRLRLKFEVLILLSASARLSVEWAAKQCGRGQSHLLLRVAVWRLAFDALPKGLIIRQRHTLLHGPISMRLQTARSHFIEIGF